MANLSVLVTSSVPTQITDSPGTITAIVDILTIVGNVSTNIVEETMQVSGVASLRALTPTQRHSDTVTGRPNADRRNHVINPRPLCAGHPDYGGRDR